ncbi:MAG TPA: hypothetical protein VGF14_03800 [Alphaproteobacteria bacterium]
MRLSAFPTLSSVLIASPALAAPPNVYYSSWQQSLADVGPWLVPLMVIIGPIIGFGLVCLTLVLCFRHMGTLKVQTETKQRQDDHQSHRRDRLVLASALAGELNENKIKCEAFITIYSELLRNLRETDRRALYEDTGDFIHQYPPLSRKTFESNIDKINLLGIKLATDVTNAYASVRNDAEYFTLDATMPRANAIRMVEMVLDDAQRTLEPLEGAVSALNMIVRDGSVSKSANGK